MKVNEERVYVADCGNNRVQVFTKAGVYVKSIGDRGGADGGLVFPIGVSVDDQHVLVSSYGGNYVSLFEKASGRFVRRFGTAGCGKGQFEHPGGVALDGEHVYVVDRFNHRLQVWTKGGMFVRVIGSGEGTGAEQLKMASGVAVDEKHVFVCDCESIRVFRKSDGMYVRSVSDGLETSVFTGISIKDDQIFVTDSNHQRVVEFQG